MRKSWPLRVALQGLVVVWSALLALNAAYLVRLSDQAREPGLLLHALATSGVFPFGVEAGTLSIEDYCPFGPLEGLVRFVTTVADGQGMSFVGPVTLRNLGVLLAVAGLVLITKKTFCGWLCPFGAVFEGIHWAARRVGLPVWRPRPRTDRLLANGRYAVLLGLVGLTGWSGTLVFREVDPFLALYSLGSARLSWIAYALLGGLVLGAALNSGIWCRYLCPLGGFLDPLSRWGWIRVHRDPGRCKPCGHCSTACPQRIPVARRQTVTDATCTNCLRCLDACPEEDALELRLGSRS